ncbi:MULTISPECIES: hypothetical protein [unclassified Micromonospora]|uniref:hypothetical protein n=1 Tax=unclassified Micromonospora TaxID=2617518 RepID=UPI00363FD008
MNLWFWPFSIGADTQLSYVAGAPVLENLHRLALFTAVTSTFGWDTGRAITTAVAIVLAGPAVLAALRRAARRAAFGAPVTFAAADPQAPDPSAGSAAIAGPTGTGVTVLAAGPARPSPTRPPGPTGEGDGGGGSHPGPSRPVS